MRTMRRWRQWLGRRVPTARALRSCVPELTRLEDRWQPSTINFVRVLGSAAQFQNSTTSLDIVTTSAVAPGHSILLEFAMKPATGAVAAYIHAAGSSVHLLDFHVDAEAINLAPGGGPGGAVRTDLFSVHGVPAIPVGSVITMTFPSSDAQSASAAEFRGLNAAGALDRVASATDSTSTVSSGLTATTTQANELIVGNVGVRGQVDSSAPNDSTDNLGFTAGANFTVWAGNGTPSGNSGNKNSSIHPEYRTVSAIGNYLVDGLLNTNAGGPWAAIVATYKADLTDHFVITAPLTVGAGMPFSFAVTAKDDTGNTSAGYTGTIHFTSSDVAPGVVLPADYTFTLADHGTHTFTSGATLQSNGPQTLTATDIENAPAITGSATIQVLGPHFTISAPASTTAGAAFVVTVTARQFDDQVNTGYVGTVHFTSTDVGVGVVLPANYTFLPGDNGVHTFTGVVLVTAGPQGITVRDTVNGGMNGTATVTVNAAAATTFAVAGFPSPVAAGTAGTFTVTAEDAFGNTATSYTGTVHFTSSDGQATLPADSTLTNGTGSFSATLRTEGTQSLTATDTVSSAITGSQTGILVTAATATHFAVSAPATAVAGSAFNFTVTALDQFNNTATGYAGTVHFTSSDGQAALPANGTLTNGTGTFSATLKTAGAQSLTATDTVNASITGSATITVTAATATHFAVSAPASVTAGSSFNFTVTALDQFNNTATGYGGTVHFTSSDGQATLPANGTLTNGTGSFSATLKTASAQTLTATDTVNAVITGSATITVTAAATTHFAVSAPTSTAAGAAFSFTVTARDQFNNTATGYGGTVHFTSSDGQATLPGNSTLTNGTGSFSATLRTAGAQSLTATDTANASITGSATITVTAAAATHFAVSAPASVTAGSSFNFTVTALDQFNNTATGYGGTVHFTSSDGQATLPANSTLSNGTGSFSATLKTAGAQSLTATDTVNATITGSATITVTAAAATHFAVSAPASVTAGSSFNFTVTALDQFNNTATGYGGTVHFTSSDGQATLPTNSTLTNGAGTFSATLKTAGAQSLTATDTVNASITGSATITVTAAAATHFAVSAPATVTAGSAFSFTVTALDQFNNTATSYPGTAHFTSSDGQATLPANSTLTNGTGSFSATLRTAGAQTLTASDTANASITGSATITVTAAAATHFVVAGFPNPTTAGAAGVFTVTAEDAFGNTATSYAGTAHFTSSDGQASLPVNSALTGGVGTFTATLKTAGTQSITATDTANASITGSQLNILVNAAAAASLVVTAPAQVTAGSPFSATVTAFDQYGNVATGYTGTIHFTSSAAVASLPADYTFSGADAGSHSFSNVSLSSSGDQTLTATDTVTSTITGSATINVIAAAGVGNVIINGADGAVLGGTDSYSIQRSKVNSIVINFISTVTLDAGAIVVQQYSGSSLGSSVGLVITSATTIIGGVPITQVTLRFTGGGIVGGSLADGNYRLSVDYTKVHFTDGRTTPPANFTDVFFRLFGDSDGNRTVNAIDQAAFQAAQGSHPGNANYRWYFDYDVPDNGSPTNLINTLDYYQFQLRYGQTLPPP